MVLSPCEGARRGTRTVRHNVRLLASAAARERLRSYDMNIIVHVKSKCMAISCGDGQQPVRWLANVATARYDDSQGMSLGLPVGVKLESGDMLDPTRSIVESGLGDMQHVWVVHEFPGPGSGRSTNKYGKPQPSARA